MNLGEIIILITLSLPIAVIVIACIAKKRIKTLLLVSVGIIFISLYYLNITILQDEIINVSYVYYRYPQSLYTKTYDFYEDEELINILNNMTFKKQNLLNKALSKQYSYGEGSIIIRVFLKDSGLNNVELCLDETNIHERYLFQELLNKNSEHIHCVLRKGNQYYYSEDDSELRQWLLEKFDQ